MKDRKRTAKCLTPYLQMTAGVIMASFAISVFYTPNKIVNGGVSGISTILYHVFGIQPGLSYAVINLILLLIAYRFLGRQFVIRTVAGAGMMSLLVQLFSYLPPVTDNVILATVFGAVLYGIGIGIALIGGASTGGTDILGRLLQLVFPHLEIGRLLLAVDAAVILASLAIFRNVELALWGVVALFVSTFAIDWLIRKLNVSKIAFVVTGEGERIAQELISASPRGVTILDSRGAFTMNGNYVLMCALKEREILPFQKRVTELDPNSFIIYSEAQSIVGNGFHVYR